MLGFSVKAKSINHQSGFVSPLRSNVTPDPSNEIPPWLGRTRAKSNVELRGTKREKGGAAE
jgi:hypothetical protein